MSLFFSPDHFFSFSSFSDLSLPKSLPIITAMYQPCSPDQYALPGSSDCEEKEPCSMTDYSFYFTPCSEGQKQFRYEKLDPGCVDVDGVPAFPYANDTQIDCGDCPVGIIFF